MRTQEQSSAIDRMLRSHGLPPLETGAGLVAELAGMVTDHEHFRTMLARCEPENRSAMYDGMKPYLNFPAMPLDAYIARSAELAEANKLPTMDASGNLHWPSTPEVTTEVIPYYEGTAEDIAAAQDAVNKAFAKRTLVLTCRACTKEETFTGDRKVDAIMNARNAGWVYCREGEQSFEICPTCPATRKV